MHVRTENRRTIRSAQTTVSAPHTTAQFQPTKSPSKKIIQHFAPRSFGAAEGGRLVLSLLFGSFSVGAGSGRGPRTPRVAAGCLPPLRHWELRCIPMRPTSQRASSEGRQCVYVQSTASNDVCQSLRGWLSSAYVRAHKQRCFFSFG